MLAFRAVVSVLVSFVWGLSLRTQGRPCGRPPAALGRLHAAATRGAWSAH